MEEDIENIERVIDYIQLESPIIQGIGNAIYTDSLKKILKRYKELEEENKKLEKSYKIEKLKNVLDEESLKEALEEMEKDFIPISVIQNKIDEIRPIVDSYEKQMENDEETDLSYEEVRDYACKIRTLQELLEERE